MKKLLVFLLLIAAAIGFWFAFALWTGLYSVYSFPPTKAEPEGRTLIVSRDEGEPMFNSPAVRQAPPKKVEKRGIGFGGGIQIKRPLEARTIVELPYIEWAYDRSIEDAKTGEQ